MSISIYYTATRASALTPHEEQEISRLVEASAVDASIEHDLLAGVDDGWESFTIYARDAERPDVIFEGATKLPADSADALWRAVQHWCELLSRVKLALRGSDWTVSVDDHAIAWDASASAFDPSS